MPAGRRIAGVGLAGAGTRACRRGWRVGVVAGLAAVAVTGLAGPADAHAVLLQTDPGPLAVAARAPAAVRLVFSEAMEASPGWIRMLDSSGRRVDRGAPASSSGGLTIAQPLGRLADGTYRVSWRAMSADSHPVQGGFVFYVGQPSTAAPPPIEAAQAASSLVGVGYGVVRFAWFAGLLALVGMVAVRRLVWTPTLRELQLLEGPLAEGFRRRFSRALPTTWAVLAAATVLALWFQAASVEGTSLAGAASPEALGVVLATSFGRWWLLQAGLVAVLGLPVVALVRRTRLGGSPRRCGSALAG